MFGRLLFLTLIAVPIVEVVLFIEVAQSIGFWPALAGIIIISLFGAAVIRQQGMAILRDIRTTFGAGRLPARPLADAMLVAVAGVLMLVPGYFTDIIGLLLLVPALRAWAYDGVIRRFGFAPARTASRPSATTRGKRDGAGKSGNGPTIDLGDDEFRPN